MTEKKNPAPPPEDKAEVAEDMAAELAPIKRVEEAVAVLIDGYSLPHVRGAYDQRLVGLARDHFTAAFLILGEAIRRAQREEGGE